MYTWTCTCGDGGASLAVSWEDARQQGDLHVCRLGRAREGHAVLVREATGAA